MFAPKLRKHETKKDFSFEALSKNFERWRQYDRWWQIKVRS